jgi:hypothetical protein
MSLLLPLLLRLLLLPPPPFGKLKEWELGGAAGAITTLEDWWKAEEEELSGRREAPDVTRLCGGEERWRREGRVSFQTREIYHQHDEQHE